MLSRAILTWIVSTTTFLFLSLPHPAISSTEMRLPANAVEVSSALILSAVELNQALNSLEDAQEGIDLLVELLGPLDGSPTGDSRSFSDILNEVVEHFQLAQEQYNSIGSHLNELNGLREMDKSVLQQENLIVEKAARDAMSGIHCALNAIRKVEGDFDRLGTRSQRSNQDQLQKIIRNLTISMECTEDVLSDIRSLDVHWVVQYAFDLHNLYDFPMEIFNIYICGGFWVTKKGTAGDDYLEGGLTFDVINGLGGDDVIYGDPKAWGVHYGYGKTDIICGGAGNDKIYARGEHNYIYGGTGDDRLYGTINSSTMWGGPGNDYLHGGSGDEVMYGGEGDDDFFGLGGEDEIYGEQGNDDLNGGQGNDVLYGGHGSDDLFGGAGDDRVYGGPGTEQMFEEPSMDPGGCSGLSWDFLSGGSGNDLLVGQGGNDRIWERGDDNGTNTIFGGYIQSGPEEIKFPDGADCIFGGDGTDFAWGGDGNDKIDGYEGNDLLVGNEGGDGVFGRAGSDLLYGNAGNDTLLGDGDLCCIIVPPWEAGDDIIYGSSGDDYLSGGDGKDTCDGGADVDSTDVDDTCEEKISIP